MQNNGRSPGDFANPLRSTLHHLNHILRRQSEQVSLLFKLHNSHHRQRDRQAQAKAGSDARATVYLQITLQVGHHRFAHHIKTHTAPRQLRDYLAGGKAGMKNQLITLLLGELSGHRCGNRAFADRLRADGLIVETATVIFNAQ